MAPIKSLLPAALLLAAAAAGFALHGAEAAGTISGIVPCSIGSSINVAAVPAFPNARVQLVCGGRAAGGATADGNGAFKIELHPASAMMLATSPIDCKVKLLTPLAACNASFAGVTGTLEAPLQVVGDAAAGGGGLAGLITLIQQILAGILSVIPLPFSLT